MIDISKYRSYLNSNKVNDETMYKSKIKEFLISLFIIIIFFIVKFDSLIVYNKLFIVIGVLKEFIFINIVGIYNQMG